MSPRAALCAAAALTSSIFALLAGSASGSAGTDWTRFGFDPARHDVGPSSTEI